MKVSLGDKKEAMMADVSEFVKELKALAELWRVGAREGEVASKLSRVAWGRVRTYENCANDLEGLIEGWGFMEEKQ